MAQVAIAWTLSQDGKLFSGIFPLLLELNREQSYQLPLSARRLWPIWRISLVRHFSN